MPARTTAQGYTYDARYWGRYRELARKRRFLCEAMTERDRWVREAIYEDDWDALKRWGVERYGRFGRTTFTRCPIERRLDEAKAALARLSDTYDLYGMLTPPPKDNPYA